MPSQAQIRQEITRRILAALEKDLVPWRRPWTTSANSGRFANVLSRRPYSGVNPLLLQLHADQHGLNSRWYATFDQWKNLGGNVRKRPENVERGQWGAKIVFYRPVRKSVIDLNTGEERDESYCIMRTYSVFNADQVDGDAVERFKVVEQQEPAETPLTPDFDRVQNLVDASGADIRQIGDRAFYVSPTPLGSWPEHEQGDYIQVPPRNQFKQPGSFYETLLHELAHWSEVRLQWDREKNGYAMGELIAEMASCYLSAELGVPQGESLDNHSSYLKNWLEAMKADTSYIFKASTQASKVTDFLLAFERREVEASEPTDIQHA